MKTGFFVLLSLISLSSFASSDTGQNLSGTYSSDKGSLAYNLYIPAGKKEKRPLLVVLHGCFMSGDQMASGTDLNSLADQKQFLVLYPEQSYTNNAWKCWNWFLPENLQRGSGEASLVAGMTKKIIQENNVDPARVYVSGISAGGAFASDLVGCYSDIFAGLMVHSGMEYAAASTEDEAHAVAKSGSTHNLDESAKAAFQCSPKRKTLIPVIVFQGSSDPYVNPVNADHVISQFKKLNLLIAPQAKLTQTTSRIDQTDYKFSAAVSDFQFDGVSTLKLVTIEGMGHAWSGGNSSAPYMEPRGVDASSIMVDFFLAQGKK